jgi:hypothetical protein
MNGRNDLGAGAGGSGATVVGFVAEAAGMGRTNVIVNVAWIMASAGARVLVVDWSTDPTAEHEYLRPFHAMTIAVRDVLADRPDLLDGAPAWLIPEPSAGDPAPEPDGPEIDRYDVLSSDGRGAAHIDVLSTRAADGTGRPPHSEPAWTQSRRILGQMPYDYVLVDSSTGFGPQDVARNAKILDVAVVCFLPRARAVGRAARLAESMVREAAVRLRIVGLAMQFDDSQPKRAQRSRNLIQDEFANLTGTAAEHTTLEIPYHPYYEYDEALAVLLDEPDDRGSLLASYERLTDAITAGGITALVPPPDAVRDHYRRQVGLESAAAAPRIAVVYEPIHRPWADWARLRLTRAGAEVVMVAGGATGPAEPVTGTLVIDSPSATRAPLAPDAAQSEDGSNTGTTEVVAHLVVGGTVTDAREDTFVVAGQSEQATGTWLLGRFTLIDKPGVAGSTQARFPDAVVPGQLNNLPPRNPNFTGRDSDLEALRDSMVEPSEGPRTLGGPAGVGKSEIAREYAHRFSFDYDVVWWVPAHDRLAARASMLALAEEGGFSASGDSVRELLDNLSAGQLGRWLLIFDNVDDLSSLANLQPTGPAGHLLGTVRRNQAPPGSVTVVVQPFDVSNSQDVLRDNVVGLSLQDSALVADAVRNLPLAVRLAAAWLREATTDATALGATVDQAAEWSAGELLDRLRRMDEHGAAR